MPVEQREVIKIKTISGTEITGVVKGIDLVVIENEDGLHYGLGKEAVRIETKIVCDNPNCINSVVGDDFVTRPKSIEFVDNGTNDPEFIKMLADIVIVSDYKGAKKVFCTQECAAKFMRKESRIIVLGE